MDELRYCRFAVNERAYCVWEWDLDERNAAFVEKLDPDYFEYLAQLYSGPLSEHGETIKSTGSSSTDARSGTPSISVRHERHEHHAALAIRLAYSHALEAFFSLFFAVLQAPACIGGWLLRYQQSDLRALVQKVSRGQTFLSRFPLSVSTWEGIATSMFPVGQSDGLADSCGHNFGRLWSQFALDFLDEDRTHEYNSFKHGLRVGSGGFTIASALEAQPGVRPPAESFVSMGGSKFGSTFFKPEDLSKDRRHFRTRWKSLNWLPENHLYGLTLLSVSMHNIITFQKTVTGKARPEDSFRYPRDPEFFTLPWRLSPGVTGIDWDDSVHPQQIRPLAESEILAVYQVGDD